MKRIFIAVKIIPGETLSGIISSLRAGLRSERINWTSVSNMHLTLVFLGNTQDDKIKTVSAILREGCQGYGEWGFSIRGTGVFRNFDDPRVLWAGIEPCDRLNELQGALVSRLRGSGFRLEERAFRPHLTLARIRSVNNPDDLRSVVKKFSDIKIQDVNVSEVILYESILRPAGPEYLEIGNYGLK